MDLLLFPHQLFEQVPLVKCNRVFLLEEPLFFKDEQRCENLATVKLVYTRATMSAFMEEMHGKNVNVERIEFEELQRDGLQKAFKKRNIEKAKVYEVADVLLTRRLKATGIDIEWMSTPNFLLPTSEYPSFIKSCNNPYHQTNFYKYMRDTREIMKNKDGGYEGGKLTFDSENRKPMPDSVTAPSPFVKYDKGEEYIVREADEYIKKVFGKGQKYKLLFPISRGAAYKHLELFLSERFEKFGPFQDAMRSGTLQSNVVLFHSGISGALNCGLLDPQKVVDLALKFKKPKILASVEGFIRQVIGWREFIRFVYETRYKDMVLSNQLSAKYSLDDRWYKGELGIPPIDDCIQVAFKYGYLHHILRLMLVANFMTLSMIHPHEMYKWFMEFSLDSYDWVMLPNVHGMASYSTDLLSTKPYISSSNYVLKMSNYKKDGKWDRLWDAMYYNFLFTHEDRLTGNGRIFFMLNNARKKSAEERENLIKHAQTFLGTLKSVSKRKCP